jgi:DNA-binding NarL/FixJ family response regulator
MEMAATTSLFLPDHHRHGLLGVPPEDGLTQRQRQVAVLVARGLTNRQIADRLAIGKRTVDTHVIHLLNKLGGNSRAQIAAWAADQGLLAGFHD